ncbi:MAG: 50S ribosomal protein L5 [Verrucomicrobiae bacterium]|nr:50S ribosomal protein L5 [Verrucomicrobiae bacterium]
MNSLVYEDYQKLARPALKKKFGYGNDMQIPRIQKVVVNICMGSAQDVKLALEDAERDMTMITGQKPTRTKSKKSIATFKLRQGQEIGVKVTLRNQRMYEFLDRLIKMSLPRIRDFRGVSPRAFDGRGNYTFGITDHSIFPEIELDKIKRSMGMDVTVVTSARTNEEAKELLSLLGVPFSDKMKKAEEAKAKAATAAAN